MPYQILLYYLYGTLDQPALIVERQRELCQRLGLTGRIIVAEEGINGTVEGTVEHTEAYVKEVLSDPQLSSMHFKRSPGTGSAFPKLSVKLRSEIVSAHLGNRDVNPVRTTGSYLSAQELHEWINSDREFYIVDMRNDYEHEVGHFEGSLLPRMHHFRELPAILPELEHLRDKTVVTVCTGGVRCEKASGFLVENGFADVHQLYGGIVTYMEAYPNRDFKGKLYVFDGRVTMGFNTESAEHQVIGRCQLCAAPSERYVNCANDDCHRHFICCENCEIVSQPTFCRTTCSHLAVAV